MMQNPQFVSEEREAVVERASPLCSEVEVRREQHIPLSKAELLARLFDVAKLSEADRSKFESFAQILSAVIHHEYHFRLEKLKQAYWQFDPDGGSRASSRTPSPERDSACNALFAEIVSLFERANYRRLSRAELDEALDSMSEVGVRLDVELAAFQRLEVFVRGDTTARRTRRYLKNLYRRCEIDVPTYDRLVVAFHPHESRRIGEHGKSEHVYLKMFKNIPKMDLEMLLPGTRVRMSLLDQGRIILPAVSGVALTVYKILQGALVLAFAGVYGMLALLGIVGGTIGYGVRSFVGYLRTKDKHQLYLTRSLYFQNLDNNQGVLFRALDEAEDQDFREAMLAYFLLWQRLVVSASNGAVDGVSLEDLDAEAESFVRAATNCDVDFEIGDALTKLQHWQLVEKRPEDRWRAKPLEEAIALLDRRWDEAYRLREQAERGRRMNASDE
jgi:hypothetical protein